MRPVTSDDENMRNMTKRIFAMPAAPAAIPPKPKAAATIALMKKTRA
jgi:hypothetical protein